MSSSSSQVVHEDGFLCDLPSYIPRYKYLGQAQFRSVIDLELQRLEKSLIASVQERDRRREEADNPGVQNSVPLSRGSQQESKQQRHSHQVPRSTISLHQPRDTLDETDASSDDELPSDCVLFHIPARSIESDILNSSEPFRGYRFSFDLAANLLLVRMITLIHSDIGQFINMELTLALNQMGLAGAICFYSGATIRSGGSDKEGDQGWGPLSPPQGYSRKPSVTLEVGVSESHAKLRRDVDWWLDPEKGNANITFIVKVDRRSPRIIIDKWERVSGVIPGTQHVDISRVNGRIVSADASLTIPFDSLFLRQPAVSEADITLDRRVFEELAERTWQLQGF